MRHHHSHTLVGTPSPGTNRAHDSPRAYDTSPMPSNPYARRDRRRSPECASLPPSRNASTPTLAHPAPIPAGCSLRKPFTFLPAAASVPPLPSVSGRAVCASQGFHSDIGLAGGAEVVFDGKRADASARLASTGCCGGRRADGLCRRLAATETTTRFSRPQIGALICPRARRADGRPNSIPYIARLSCRSRYRQSFSPLPRKPNERNP